MKPKKSLKIVAALGAAAVMSGCSDLDERPFVMACMPENVFDYKERQKSVLEKDTATFDFDAGGIPFPSPEEMKRRADQTMNYWNPDIPESGYHNGYFGQGILTDQEGKLPEIHTTEAMFSDKGTLLAKYGRGNKIYRYSRKSTQPGGFVEDRTGKVDMEHYYLDGDGALHPIYFQIAALNVGKISTHDRPLLATHRQIHVGSMIPSDAKYVVYKATWHFQNHENHDPDNTFTGYWAHALTDEYRYQPNDYEYAKDHRSALGSYVMWMNVRQGGRTHIGQPTEHDLNPELAPASKSSGWVKGDTVPCYGVAGQPVPSKHFLNIGITYKEENAIFTRSNTVRDGFVGTTEKDLANLPSDPDDWEEEKNQYLNQRFDL